jgi:hypothetical protein
MTELRVIYLQEFLMTSPNPVCVMAGYAEKVYKIFPGLVALDGNRKTVTMNFNMVQALPEEEKINFEYDTSRLSWYENEGEIKDPNTAMAKMFEPGTNSKREERDL